MTREEAKEKIFNQWQDFLEHNLDYAGISEAYKMAIEALEQEPCDAVSRKAAIDSVVLVPIAPLFKGDNVHYERVVFENVIKNLPPVTPAEKVGHWEYVQYDGNPNIGNWHCSECSAIVNYKPTYNWDKKPYYKYCPNCGAKMQEVEDDQRRNHRTT